MEALLRWYDEQAACTASEQGARCLQAKVAGRRLLATQDILPGECFLRVPQKLLLHAGLAVENEEYATIFKALEAEVASSKGAKLDERLVLCLLLLLERARGTTSRWHNYIAVLPPTYDDPLWWSQEDCRLLEGTRLEPSIAQYRHALTTLTHWRDRLHALCRETSSTQRLADMLDSSEGGWCLTSEATLWARSTVWSRAFNVSKGDPHKTICLVPVADMLDHNPDRHVAWHCGKDGGDDFQMLTHPAISQGAELFSNYGNKSNEELLAAYGFMLEDNVADFFHVSLGLRTTPTGASLEEDDSTHSRLLQRSKLLQGIGLPHVHYLRRQQPLPAALLAASGICSMPDELAYALSCAQPAPEAQSQNGEKRDAGGSVQIEVPGISSHAHKVPEGAIPTLPVSPGTQLAVLAALRQQLQAKLDAIPGGSSAEDSAAALLPSASSHAAMALKYRAGVKHIAELALDALRTKLSGLLQVASAVAREGGLLLPETVASSTSMSVEDVTLSCIIEMLPHSDRTSSSPSSSARSSEPTGIAASLGRHPQWPGWHLGISIRGDIQRGDVLANIPHAMILRAPDREQLAFQLVRGALSEGWLAGDFVADPDFGEGCAETVRWCGRAVAAAPHARLGVQEVSLLAGLPAQEALIQESQEAQEAFEQVLPRLEAATGMRGVPTASAFRILQWAQAVVERCGFSAPAGHVAIAPYISALPQALHGEAAQVTWTDTGAILTACCPMAAGTQLSDALLLIGQDPTTQVVTHGIEALACIARARAGGKVVPQHLGGCWLRNSFQLDISVPEEDPEAVLKHELLVSSALGTSHFLTAKAFPERLLAAICVCAGDRAALEEAGAAALTEALLQASSAGPCEEAVAGLSGIEDVQQGALPPDVHRQLLLQQEQFSQNLLKHKQLQKVSKQQMKALLRSIREEMQVGALASSPGALPGQLQRQQAAVEEVRKELCQILDTWLAHPTIGHKMKRRTRKEQQI